MADTFWKDTTDFLLTSMGTDLFDKSANLITSIAPLFSIGFGIYFMIIILNAYGRGFDGNAVDFAKKTVAWLIIIMCAFNAAQYQKIANMLYEFPEWLSSTFNGQFDASAIDTAWDSIMKAVENILASGAKLDWDDIAGKMIMWVAAGMLIFLGAIFFSIVLAYYLVAKLSLAMVLLIGPLFLGMMLFPSTRQYAMNWIGQIFNYSVTIAFFTILMSLQMKFFENHIIKSLNDSEFHSAAELAIVFPILITSTMIFIIVALNIPSIASALTGGSGAGGFSNMVNFVRQALNSGQHSSPLTGSGLGIRNKSRAAFNKVASKFGNSISKR